MPVSELISKLTLADATRGDIQAQTALRWTEVMMGQRQMQEEAKRDAVLNQLASQQATETAKQASMDTTGKSEVDVVRSQVQDWNQQYQNNQRRINALEAAGLYKYAKPYELENDKLRESIRRGQIETMRIQNDAVKDIGNIASSVKDQASLEAALPLLREKDKTFGMRGSFDRDPDTAEVVWGPKTKATLQALSDRTITAEQKYQNALRDANLARQIQNDKDREQDRQSSLALREGALVMARAGQQSLIDAREARAEESRARTARITRLSNTAEKPATKQNVDAAGSTIQADSDFKGKDWDGTLKALSNDVADRANQIRAEAARNGEEIGYADARQQAWEEYKPYVHEQPKEGSGFFGIGAKTQLTYARAPKGKESASAAPMELPKTESDLKDGQTYKTVKGAARWDAKTKQFTLING